jgi:hypothetical protein
MALPLPPPPPPVVPVETVDEARASAAADIARLEATMDRASGSFTEEERSLGVDDEWSTVQSLRHLVLVVDLWLTKTILGEADPFHPMALPPSFMPPRLPGTSIDPDASPTFGEACEVLRGRLEAIRSYVGTLTAEELARPVPAHAKTVGGALSVLFSELRAHDRFVNRDLDVIEERRHA